MKIGIFFGGPSREREISFAGGRTVYDNLDKNVFEPVPVFVDSFGQFILLDWQYIYKGTIRDFYPPISAVPPSLRGFQIYLESLTNPDLEAIAREVGQPLQPHQFRQHFDFAFLALHGPYGEDGNIQGLLEWYGIPYSGCGVLPSAIGIDKGAQKELMAQAGFAGPDFTRVSRTAWLAETDKTALMDSLVEDLGLPLVVKAPHQGSSIGVSIVAEADVTKFAAAVNRSLFIQELAKADWQSWDETGKINYIRTLTDIREGIGMPVWVGLPGTDLRLMHHPEELYHYLEQDFPGDLVQLISPEGEDSVLVESFIRGQEFSCIVIQDEKGNPLALPPTGIIKREDLFNYRSKYLPGMSRKVTPIDLPEAQLEAIRRECCRLFETLHCNVYARIDGFVSETGEIFLNDPNTTSGMLPSSFFFHQAAEIGLNPSQFLTYIIRTSLAERIKAGKNVIALHKQLAGLDAQLQSLQQAVAEKKRVAVIMGGFSSERHISVESGRNIFEKLASSTKYEAFPVFLTGSEAEHELYLVPVNVMLKDNADDIREKVHHVGEVHPILAKIRKEATAVTQKYAGNPLSAPQRIRYEQLAERADVVFIALHGRPGEDGAVQTELERVGLPYNGSGVASSQITINKWETNELLAQHGVSVAKHRLVDKTLWLRNKPEALAEIEAEFRYPFITKPADDGCSSAVKKIKNREELVAFGNMIFREAEPLLDTEAQTLKLQANEEFPQKQQFLIEELITRNGALHFLEITGGLLTRLDDQGNRVYEVFEPSEALASGEVLSLEEKFLAGEGQNITPARFASTTEAYRAISAQVRSELEKVARLLNVEGYARIDAFVRIFEDNRAETIIIEVNSLPGMTPATCIFHQTAINGYKPYHFIDAILEYGQQRQRSLNVSH
ncbi:D-alanine-D-alanine ligase [Catalinimonas alkaloidigena]|uniref:D-alanine--D-alanine ligase n=1 Tax=Catalinimonas alkaloidigena TaxID=1075417 RepID=A0A1G8WUL0_9BACT|nr:D-alanine--D-alanine ligase [Catalinimonas alkaloidigena]SDJ82048.1 D-alanine-D-alanine ligase [Catalinimonas alkaloidigena]